MTMREGALSFERVQEQVGEQEVVEVVYGEGAFDAGFGLTVLGEDRPGVVYQYVQAVVAGLRTLARGPGSPAVRRDRPTSTQCSGCRFETLSLLSFLRISAGCDPLRRPLRLALPARGPLLGRYPRSRPSPDKLYLPCRCRSLPRSEQPPVAFTVRRTLYHSGCSYGVPSLLHRLALLRRFVWKSKRCGRS